MAKKCLVTTIDSLAVTVLPSMVVADVRERLINIKASKNEYFFTIGNSFSLMFVANLSHKVF